MKKRIESFDEKDTFSLGLAMGKRAKAGDVIALDGDLGVGKTVFTKGLAEGLKIMEPVCSPTFTILQSYETGRLPLYHFDVYRIGSSDEMEEIGFEDCIYGEGVTLIEWAEKILDLMPNHFIHVIIEKDLSKGFDYRIITIENEEEMS